MKNGLNFSIPPKFIKKNGCVLPKFMTKDIKENEVSTQIESELMYLPNYYIYKISHWLKLYGGNLP